MPTGTGAPTLSQIPAEPYVVDPGSFAAMTSKNIFSPTAVALPGLGSQLPPIQLPQVGIISKIRVVFDGSMVVATAAPTETPAFPYNLLSSVVLSANGQNNLWQCSGLDLQVLRLLRFPSYVDSTDQPGGTAVGTHPLYLTWEIPIAMDEMSLVGALFAQSASTNLTLSMTLASAADMFSANAANVTITGTFYVQITTFEVPFDQQGRMIIPDLSKNHSFVAFETPISGTGDNVVPLIRSNGSLTRLLQRAVNGPFNTGSPLALGYVAGAAPTIDRVRLEYGGNQRPYDFNPGTLLRSLNNEQYGDPLPYAYWCNDFVREYPQRDVILMAGVTNLNSIVTVDSGVAVDANAIVHTVQETLY